MSDIIDYLIADFQERPLPKVTRRDVGLPAVKGKADAVIGMRRSGKTYLLFQEMHRLLESGVDKERLLYLNFEDDRLGPPSADTLSSALEAFYRRNPEARASESYLFLDEVQNVPGWERFARRVLDTEDVRLWLTGSSAKLLSREIATSLRGRSTAVEVLPFSFAESLRHAGIEPPGPKPPGARTRSLLENRLGEYLRDGGFPEVQGIDDRDRVRILQEYVDVVIFRDVVERHRADNVVALRYMTRRLLDSAAQSFSVNKLYNDLRSQGVAVGKDTLHAYLAHLVDAFMVFLVPIHRKSLRARAVNPRKAYCVDPGLARAMSHVGAPDTGSLLENFVYLELRRNRAPSPDDTIFYHITESGREVDFLVEGAGPKGRPLLIQACADLSPPATRERELLALSEAMAETRTKEAWVITMYEQSELRLAEGLIRILPAWKWALDHSLMHLINA